MKNRLYLLLLLCLFASCEEDLPLPSNSGTQKITLIGELIANDTVQLRAGQSMYLGSKPAVPANLQISLSENAGPVTPLQERWDYKIQTLYTLPFSSPTQILAGKNYKIIARHPSLGEVHASAQIPTAFAATLVGQRFTEYAGDSVLALDIDINDLAAPGVQYLVEVFKRQANITVYFFYNSTWYSVRNNQFLYDSLKNAGVPLAEKSDTTYAPEYSRQQFYINDDKSDNGPTGSRLFSRSFLKGESFAGTTHRTQVLIPRRYIYGDPGLNAQTLVFVKSIAADYYKFLKAYDAYPGGSEPDGNNLSQELPGNVVGGYGMVGGVWKWEVGMVY